MFVDLVSALLPDEPELDAKARAVVLSEVVRFVDFEIRALPAHLRLPYRLGLSIFEWAAVLRYGRRFHSLASPRRASYLAAWSERGIGLTRDLVKLVCVCALLQYFDHPLVVDALRARDRSRAASQSDP